MFINNWTKITTIAHNDNYFGEVLGCLYPCLTVIWNKGTRLVNTKTKKCRLMVVRPWHSRVQNMKILQNVFTRDEMYKSYSRWCWCNCCCWDAVVVIGKVRFLSSNPRALTCFVWGISFFFDCSGRPSISYQNVGKVLPRRVVVAGAHRVILRHVELALGAFGGHGWTIIQGMTS